MLVAHDIDSWQRGGCDYKSTMAQVMVGTAATHDTTLHFKATHASGTAHGNGCINPWRRIALQLVAPHAGAKDYIDSWQPILH